MSTEIAPDVLSNMPALPQALAALTALEVQVVKAETYQELRKIIHEAQAWKALLGHIDEVRIKAEDAIIAAKVRIGETFAAAAP